MTKITVTYISSVTHVQPTVLAKETVDTVTVGDHARARSR
jgi:hypothetical protein